MRTKLMQTVTCKRRTSWPSASESESESESASVSVSASASVSAP